MYTPLFIVLIFCAPTILGSISNNSKCSIAPCPAVKATVCVEIKQKYAKRTVTTNVMMSACELKKIRCFNDVKATIIPVKYCKEKILRDGNLPDDGRPQSLLDKEVDAQVTEAKPDGTRSKENLTNKDKSNKASGESKNNDPIDIEPQTDEANGPEEIPQSRFTIPDKGDVEGSEFPQDTDEGVGTEIPGEESGSDVNPTTDIVEPTDDEKENEVVTENNEPCPKSCPTGDVMVCARCSHGIYRTFMSTCYMRMYQCQNPKEKLELVSRHACLDSAPYLGEMSRPTGNVREPHDKDPVLDFILPIKRAHPPQYR